MEKLPLVMECEWDYERREDKDPKKEYSAVKFDFQKLIVSNACLGLMIFKLRCKERIDDDLASLEDYFTDTINKYENLPKGSKFLVIASHKNRDNIKTFRFLILEKE